MNTLIQSLLEAQEAILRNELEFDTTEEEMAFESFVNDDFSGKYGLDLYSDFDSLLAMESEDGSSTESGEKKPNWIKSVASKVWTAICTAFTKIGEFFKSIGERVAKFFKDKIAAMKAKQAVKKDGDAAEFHKGEVAPAAVSAFEKATKDYSLAVVSGVDVGIMRCRAIKDRIEKIKSSYITSRTDTNSGNIGSDDEEKMFKFTNDIVSEYQAIGLARTNYEDAVKGIEKYGANHRDYIVANASRSETIKNNAEKISKECFEHYKFCNNFVKAYENKSNNASERKMASIVKSEMGNEPRSIVANKSAEVEAANNKVMYRASNLYLTAAKNLNNIVMEYQKMCNHLM